MVCVPLIPPPPPDLNLKPDSNPNTPPPPPQKKRLIVGLGGRFGYFLFFCSGGFLLKIPRGGGFSRAGGGSSAGGVFVGNFGGGGAKYFFSGPKFPPRGLEGAKRLLRSVCSIRRGSSVWETKAQVGPVSYSAHLSAPRLRKGFLDGDAEKKAEGHTTAMTPPIFFLLF